MADIYKDFESIKTVALHYAKEHKCNYNVILLNPEEDGSAGPRSTYEFVADSYFEKDRPNVILLFKTDEERDEDTAIEERAEEFLLRGNHDPYMITNPYAGLEKMYRIPPKPSQYIRPEPKINRNAPCPCESGLKYKKCCGSK